MTTEVKKLLRAAVTLVALALTASTVLYSDGGIPNIEDHAATR